MQFQQLQQCQQSIAALAAATAVSSSPSSIDDNGSNRTCSNVSSPNPPPHPQLIDENSNNFTGDSHQQFQTFLAKVRRLEQTLRFDNNSTICNG